MGGALGITLSTFKAYPCKALIKSYMHLLCNVPFLRRGKHTLYYSDKAAALIQTPLLFFIYLITVKQTGIEHRFICLDKPENVILHKSI